MWTSVRAWVNMLGPIKKAVIGTCSVLIAVGGVVVPVTRWSMAVEAQYAKKPFVEAQVAQVQRRVDEQTELSTYRWYQETRRQVLELEDLATRRRLTSVERQKLEDLREEAQLWKEKYKAVRQRLEK